MFGLSLYRVRGQSMMPALRDGQWVLTRRISMVSRLHIGDVVVAEHRVYGRIIKRITATHQEGVSLAGDNQQSSTSLDIGLVSYEQIISRCIRNSFIKSLRN